MGEDKIIGIDINKDGYGFVPKLVMQDRSISISAKAVYAYFCSFTGSGDCCFPTRKKICYDLGISNDSLSKYIKQLVDNGYLQVEQIKENGRFSHNVYKLPCTKLPCPKNYDTEYSVHENSGYENMDTKNNNSKNNNSKSNKESKSNNKNNIIEENFETLWKMLKSTQYDRKSAVTKKRKKELYEMGFERVKKAIDVYLKVQNPEFYYKRDRFFNDIIDNYLDKDVTDFNTKNTSTNSDFSDLNMGMLL